VKAGLNPAVMDKPNPDKPEPNRYDKPSALLMRRVDKRSASTFVASGMADALHLSSAFTHPTILVRK